MLIVITGSSKGLGKAIAEAFAIAGNTLLLCARNEKELLETAADIRSKFPSSIVYTKQADLSVRKDVIEFADWCLTKGKIDIIVNNAGRFLPGSVHNEPDGILEEMIETNLYSAYYLTKALLMNMIENKSGHIFNICSIASLKAYANGGSYGISKFALLGFSKNLREELKAYNIKVTAVMPGAAYTDSWVGTGVDEKRIMEATDIAKMVFAASQLSPQACVEDIIMRPQLGDL